MFGLTRLLCISILMICFIVAMATFCFAAYRATDALTRPEDKFLSPTIRRARQQERANLFFYGDGFRRITIVWFACLFGIAVAAALLTTVLAEPISN